MVGTVLEIVGFVALIVGIVVCAGWAAGLAAAGLVVMVVGHKVGEQ